jgi:hypothetical protein
MVEAVRTTASSGGLWAIVILMSLLTAFLVSAPLVADSVQTREVRRRRQLGQLGPAGQARPVIAQPVIVQPEQVGADLAGYVPWQRTGDAEQPVSSEPGIGGQPT